METTRSFPSLERAAYRTTFADGLADLCLGAWLCAFGALLTTDYAWAGGILGGAAFPAWRWLRERIAVPRLGTALFGAQRTDRQRKRSRGLRLAFSVAIVAGVVAILVLRERAPAEGEALGWGALPLGVAVSLILTALVLLFDFHRLIAYAVLILAVFVLGHSRGVDPALYVALSGVVPLATGLVLFARFLHDYPLPGETDRDDRA